MFLEIPPSQIARDFHIFDRSLMILPCRKPLTIFIVAAKNFFSPKEIYNNSQNI